MAGGARCAAAVNERPVRGAARADAPGAGRGRGDTARNRRGGSATRPPAKTIDPRQPFGYESPTRHHGVPFV